MMDVVTYSLKNGQRTSDQFYRDVAAFTDQVVAGATALHPIVERYQAYLKASGKEAVRSRDEYVFELAMLGTLWCDVRLTTPMACPAAGPGSCPVSPRSVRGAAWSNRSRTAPGV